MNRFRPYFKLILEVKGRFAVAALAGAVAGLAGGAGLPLLTDQIFPMIFKAKETGERAPAPDWMVTGLDFFGLEQPDPSTLVMIACVFFPLTFIIRGVATYTNVYLTQSVGMHVLEALRLKAFRQLQVLPLSFHTKHREGDLLARLMNDSAQLQSSLVRVGNDIIVQPATFVCAVGAVVYLTMQHSGIGVVWLALLSIPLCVLPIRRLGMELAKRARHMQGRAGDMSATAAENLASQPEIRAYNLEEPQIERFRQESNSYKRFGMKVVKYRALISPSVEILAVFGVVYAIYAGAQRDMQLKDFISIIVGMYMAYEPIKRMGGVASSLKQAEASLYRLETIIDATDDEPNPVDPKPASAITGQVKFTDVEFAYGDTPVLRGIDLEIPRGQMVALVGPSGAGKSTFVNLIPRFYEVSSGSLTLDGIDVREFSKRELRGRIAMVSQVPLLFTGTVGENIRIGRPQATDEEIREAARRANALDFIERLPDGFGTVLGQRGEGLSGGQRQRVAIARAFLRNAPILILDEATSALDNESEAKIRESLRLLCEGRTTFLIAHRLSTIRDAGRVLVFNEGRIVADGTHAELMQRSDLYKLLQSGVA